MKKGTLVFTANLEAENFCRKWMLDGAMQGGLGVAAASLPRHISLGMPYEVEDFEAYLQFAEEYAQTLHPLEVRLTELACAPMGESGSYCFHFASEADIDELRRRTAAALRKKLGLTIGMHDGLAGSRNITLGFGTAPFDAYKAYVEGADRTAFADRVLRFDGLGVFYYDVPVISASTFFCCRYLPLR